MKLIPKGYCIHCGNSMLSQDGRIIFDDINIVDGEQLYCDKCGWIDTFVKLKESYRVTEPSKLEHDSIRSDESSKPA
jgi:hypothetical protein